MACLQMGRSDFSPMLRLHYGLTLRRRAVAPTVHFRCCLRQNGGDAKGDEPPESLFMKELKKRGMNPATLLEDASYAQGEQDRAAKEENSGGLGKAKRNKVASAEYEKGASGQRERSMALNSEGIQGLIPRAKLLLTIGGTFFLGFWPLMLITISAFCSFVLFFWYQLCARC
ncbi:hypothetical protein AXF42_Ash013488 [Apostasia shenzhenica]|uniref:Uncharacterized protein n=1 Tax=Apostasia shenzhenica TaxID=1088818 RepID=A0A2I0A4C9_9ASPA|nr:hypothetical protein AXF42_Ash013488 [Apostasia shenzhenica]